MRIPRRFRSRHGALRTGTLEFAVILGTLAVVAWGCSRKAPVPIQPAVAFTANQQGNSVAVVDLAALAMLASIPVPAGPVQVAARPGSREIWAVSSSGWLSIIAYPGLRVTGSVRVGKSASSLVFSPDGRRAYVLEPTSGQLVFLDVENPKEIGRLVLGGKPSSLTLTPDGKTLIASAVPSELYFVNADSRQVLGSVKVVDSPAAMTISPDSREVFVASAGDKRVSAVEVASRRLLSNLIVASPVTALNFKPDGGEVFALSSTGSLLIVLDAFHDDVEQTFTAGLNPVRGLFGRDQSVFYIATAGDGNITAMDVQTRQVLAVAHAGTQPSALALTPDERFLAVTDAASSSLAVLRTDSLNLVTTLPVGADPVDVVIPDWPPKK